MSVRTIRNQRSEVVGYQAIKGAGKGPGSSKYFSVEKLGAAEAQRLVEKTSAAFNKNAPRRVYLARGNNIGGLPGIQLVNVSRVVGGDPVPHVVGTWFLEGHNFRTSRSIGVHGPLEAVRQVLAVLKKRAGKDWGLSPQQHLNILKKTPSALRGYYYLSPALA